MKHNVVDLLIFSVYQLQKKEEALNIQTLFLLLSALCTILWQVSTVIMAEKEIIALSSGPEAVLAHPSLDPHQSDPSPTRLASSLLHRLGARSTSAAH